MLIEFGPIAGIKLGFEFVWEAKLVSIEILFLRIAIWYGVEYDE